MENENPKETECTRIWKISRLNWGSTYPKILIVIFFPWKYKCVRVRSWQICLLHCLRPHTNIIDPAYRSGVNSGISDFVVGYQRTIITHDLYMYKCGLLIQQSVVNTNWILQTVFCNRRYSVLAALLYLLRKTIAESGTDTCAIESGTYSSSWKLWRQYIHVHGRHWIPHHNKPSDNDCEPDAIIHVVHQRRLSMNDDQTWLHFMNISCMALRKYRMETRHWGACSVVYAVPRAGASVRNLISSCHSDDWEGYMYLVALENIIKYLFAHKLPTLSTSHPLWTPIPLQPHILDNHPHPITTHTLQPHTPQNHTCWGGTAGWLKSRWNCSNNHHTSYCTQYNNTSSSSLKPPSFMSDVNTTYSITIVLRGRTNVLKFCHFIDLHCAGIVYFL